MKKYILRSMIALMIAATFFSCKKDSTPSEMKGSDSNPAFPWQTIKQ